MEIQLHFLYKFALDNHKTFVYVDHVKHEYPLILITQTFNTNLHWIITKPLFRKVHIPIDHVKHEYPLILITQMFVLNNHETFP